MKIREKALAGIICIILLFLALLAIISSSVIMKNYEDIKSAQLTDYSRLAISNIQAELSFLSTIARSWSEWDESYAFAEGKNPGFIEENFNSGSFLRYDINAIIITDERGRVLFSQGYDYDTGQLEPVPASVMSMMPDPVEDFYADRGWTRDLPIGTGELCLFYGNLQFLKFIKKFFKTGPTLYSVMPYLFRIVRMSSGILLAAMIVSLFTGLMVIRYPLFPWISYSLVRDIHVFFILIVLIPALYLHSLGGIMMFLNRNGLAKTRGLGKGL